MTINLADNTPRVSYAVAAGVTQSSFTVSFEFFDDADLNVYVDGTLKTLTTDYTVTGGDGATGSITMSVTGASGGSTVVITRDIDLKRTTDFPASGAFQVGSLNTELDKLVAIAADLDDKASRALQLTDYDSAVSLVLPDVDTRKGKTLAFNASTGAVESGPSISDVQSVSAAAADIATLADIEDGTDATDAIQTVAGISSDVTTVSGISSNVSTVAGISANVTTVAGDSSDITALAAKTTELGRLGTADAVADLNTLGTADVVSDMNTLATASNVTNMDTLAGISANITTVAGISANVTTVAGDSADIQAVAADAADIGTVASNISDVNTAATNITDIQNASTNASTATTKAAEAATSATNAATSATNASTSATNAATSATAAAASAASAATAFDNFDDTYLGAKASNPTVDNDGDPLTDGDLYFNTTENEMRVYDGAQWISASAATQASLILYEYTATSGQTTFSGSDDNAATLSYTADNLQVVMNGIVLDPSDFTATNGTSVVLASGAAAGSLINIYAFKTFTVADTVSASAGGTFSGNVTVSALLNVDNIRIDGNIISSTDTNGDITLDPDGTGDLIVASGNVGVGTTTPDSALHIEQNASGVTETSGSTLKIHNTNSSGRSKISLHNSAETASGSIYYDTDSGGLALQGDTGAIVAVHTGGNNERLRVDTNGKLLINATSSDTDDLLQIESPASGGGYGIQIRRNDNNTDQQIGSIKFGNTSDSDIVQIIGKTDGAANSGAMTFSTAKTGTTSERMRVDKNGNLIIGATVTNGPDGGNALGLVLAGNGRFYTCTNSGGNLFEFNVLGTAAVGSINVSTSGTSFNTSSDHRLKENVADMTGAIARVKQLAPKRFNFIADTTDTLVDGFLAHEAQTVVPEAVTGTHNEVDDNGDAVMQGIDQAKLVPLLTGALQEAITKIETLETKVAALEAAE